MSDPVDVAAVRARLAQHKRDERHRTVRETEYWCAQYRLFGEDAIAALDQLQRENAELRQELVDSEGYRQQCAEEHAADLAAAQAALAQAEQERDDLKWRMEGLKK